MLTPRRAAAAALAASALLAGAAASAPAARAATAGPASFGPGAARQLVQDTLNAWKITEGSGVTVAVLSTGVDPDVSGLAGKVVTGHNYVNVPPAPPVTGTLIASAIAGSGPTAASPVGSIGRAPQARILSIRIWPEPTEPGAARYLDSASWPGRVAAAVREAANSGAQVVYLQAGGYGDTAALDQAVQYALAKNVVIVGQEFGFGPSPDDPQYPVSLPGVIGVGTVFLPGLPAPPREIRSPANDSILVSAPGNDLLVTGPQGPGYALFNYAAAGAWVAGTVALIKSVYPGLSPALVARALALSARDHPPGGYNATVGFGLINPAGALQEASVLAKLRGTAGSGPGLAGPSARLGPGPAPGVIGAVHHSAVKLAGFAAAIVIGLGCLAAAAVLARRWRHGRVRIS